MSHSSRTITRLVLFALILTLSLGVSWAGLTEGSTATSRAFTDTAVAQVFIYDGGVFNNSEQVTTFSFFESAFTGSRFMTPILFQETATGQFTVVGIGASQTLVGTGAGFANSFVFDPVTAGTDTTGGSGLFFFGYINATVNASGSQLLSSAGTVTFNSTVDAPPGVDGSSTNDWVFTSQGAAGITVGLGTVFFTPGHDPGSGTRFALNTGTGSFQTDRTYSANLTGIAASIPEPGTLTLFASGAGLLLAGLLKFRRKS